MVYMPGKWVFHAHMPRAFVGRQAPKTEADAGVRAQVFLTHPTFSTSPPLEPQNPLETFCARLILVPLIAS